MHKLRLQQPKLKALLPMTAIIASVVLLCAPGGMHPSMLRGQTTPDVYKAAPDQQNNQSLQIEPSQGPVALAAGEDEPSPGNFRGSTYVPSIPAPDVESAAGMAAEKTAAILPPPAPVPADAEGDAARQQINNETAGLLVMAYALKAEVDKTSKDELSIVVVRKAGQIEQLARKMRDEIRPVLSKN